MTAVSDHAIEAGLSAARQLLDWWKTVDAAGSWAERFELTRPYNRPETAFGFFDDVSVDGKPLPIMGTVQQLLFDQDHDVSAESAGDQLREFVLRYFMRVSSIPVPQAADSGASSGAASASGFGFTQLSYRMQSGRAGKFPLASRFGIVDVRELDSVYEWVLGRVRIFNFGITLPLPGLFAGLSGGVPAGDSPSFSVPIPADNLILLARDFTSFDETRSGDVVRQYGFGYALIPDPPSASVLAYGPGHFNAGFQTFLFQLLANGSIRVRLVFVVNRPDRILNTGEALLDRLASVLTFGAAGQTPSVPYSEGGAGFDPVISFMRVANSLTGGQAGDVLGLSLPNLEKKMLFQHFMEHYEMIAGSLVTWRRIPNWTQEGALPPWVVSGVGS